MSNHEHYEDRLSFIETVLKQCNLPSAQITPLAYDEDCIFPYNNFIYLLTLSTPTLDPISSQDLQPGTSPIPRDVTKLIVRLSNSHPDTGLYPTNRVENEVAALKLARQALAEKGLQAIVPEVYKWESAKDGKQGWVLMQCLEGEPLDEVFASMTEHADKEKVLKQIAEIAYAIQYLEVPDSLKSYGGLTFNERGDIVGGQMTTYNAGPFASFTTMMKALFRSKLDSADASAILQGWSAVRPRLDKLLETGIDELLRAVDTETQCLVHGDFTMNNMLFDKTTGKITGLLDFDWAHVGHAATDLLSSYPPYARLPNRYTSDAEQLTLRKALLTAFPDPLPPSTESVDWETAKLWDAQCSLSGAPVPSTLRASDVDVLSWLYEVLELLDPSMLTDPTMLRLRSGQKEKMMREKEEAEKVLDRALTDWESGRIGDPTA